MKCMPTTNIQSLTLLLLTLDVGKTKVKIQISPMGGDTAPHLSLLPPHDQNLLVFTFR